jgi:hypothetical protein
MLTNICCWLAWEWDMSDPDTPARAAMSRTVAP